METRVFRTLLLASLALTAIANTFDKLFPGFLSASHQAAVSEQAKQGLGGQPELWVAFLVVTLLATFFSAVGLWRGERWGAWLGATTTALGFLAMPMLGSYVVSGAALSIAQLAAGLWFVVLAAAFTSRAERSVLPKAA